MTMRGRTITLPPGVKPDEVRAAFQKRHSGGSLNASEQNLLRQIRGSTGGSDDHGRSGKATSDYRFGGDFWVVVQTEDGGTRIALVRSGITDLDRVEIVSGLEVADKVLILPSAHLVETQERLQRFINRRVGTVPGMSSR